MPFLIDSDVVISYLAGELPVKDFVNGLAPSGVAISVVSFMEVLEGILAGPKSEAAQQAFDDLLIDWPIVSVSPLIARRCGRLRLKLRATGRRVRPRSLDLLIAATALQFDFVLATNNIHDYDDIPALRVVTPPST